MPVLLMLWLSMLAAALALAAGSSGWKRRLAWIDFALLALPLLVAGIGGLILSANGLAWRSCVKLSCGLALVAGILGLLLCAAIALLQRTKAWRPAAETVGACVIVTIASLLCVVTAWYGLLFTAIWSGSDRDVMVKGELTVEEHVWTEQDYYAYHGPFIRGSQRLYGSGELTREDFMEAEK